jgi:hypothetical protein
MFSWGWRVVEKNSFTTTGAVAGAVAAAKAAITRTEENKQWK